MIQNFTHLLGESWGSKLIGFRMMFPTLIFNRSLSLIDSCFQRTVNFFTVYSPLSRLQAIMVLVCLFSFLVCYVSVLTLSFSLSIAVKFNMNGMSSHDENFVFIWHILSISILKILKQSYILTWKSYILT